MVSDQAIISSIFTLLMFFRGRASQMWFRPIFIVLPDVWEKSVSSTFCGAVYLLDDCVLFAVYKLHNSVTCVHKQQTIYICVCITLQQLLSW